MKLSDAKRQVLETLKSGEHLPLDLIITKLSKPALNQVYDLLLQRFILKDLDEKYYLSRSGYDLLNNLEESYESRHNFKRGLKCHYCGINRKSISGNGFWYDDSPIRYKTSPPCKKR